MRDNELIEIVDAAVADATRRSGAWLACRPGCTQCCMGPFAITAADADRLRRGLAELETGRAARVLERARRYVALTSGSVPELLESDRLDDEPCPALDPETGLCDLYAARPLTCRMFGLPMRVGDGALGVCELCFDGASEREIAAAELELDPDMLESQGEETLVALALLLP